RRLIKVLTVAVGKAATYGAAALLLHRIQPSSPAAAHRKRSEPIASFRSLYIGRRVRRQQQPVAHERVGGGFDLGDVGLARAVAFLDRQARVATGLALGLGLREGAVGAVAVAELASRAVVDVPAGMRRQRRDDVGQQEPRDLVAVGIDRRHTYPVGLLG